MCLSSYLTEAVRERCSLESMTHPTWHSMGGLELWRVFLFRGVWWTHTHTLRFHTWTSTLRSTALIHCKKHHSGSRWLAHLGVDGPALLDDWVEAWRLRGVLEARRSGGARGAGAAVVGRVRHGGGQGAGYRGRLGGAKQLIGQGVGGDCSGTQDRTRGPGV